MKLLEAIVEFRGLVQALDRLTAALDRNTDALIGPKIEIRHDPTDAMVDYMDNARSAEVDREEVLQRIKETTTPEERRLLEEEMDVDWRRR